VATWLAVDLESPVALLTHPQGAAPAMQSDSRARRYIRLTLAPALASVLGAAACAGGETPAPTPGAPVQALPQDPAAAPDGRPPVAVAPESLPVGLLDTLRREAANAADADPAEVRVVSVDAVTWPDSSLGCGRADESALQVLTPGYAVVVEVRGAQFTLHTDRRGAVRLCPPGIAAVPAPPPGAPLDR
jgi:hypothetical protein